MKQQELDLKEKELALKEREDSLNAISATPSGIRETSQTKYLYVLVKTDEPTIVVKDEPSADNTPSKMLFAESKYFFYRSEVQEVQNYSEDKRFEAMDEYEQKVRQDLVAVDMKLEYEYGSHIEVEVKPPCPKASVVSRTAYVFDTYKEASESREGGCNINCVKVQ